MSAMTDTQNTPDASTEPDVATAASDCGIADSDEQQAPWLVPVAQLAEHPGNVREDLDLSAEFCASVAEAGVRIPLLVTPQPGGGYRVIEGHRRLAAAVKSGLEAVPCVLDPARASDEAGQLLDMVVANSDAHRKNFTPIEEATALFAAFEAGASRTRIRKATGRKADQVKTALQAGRLSPDTRAKAGELARQMTLEELALLAEFDGDQDAIERISGALHDGYNVEYVAERIRQDRGEQAEYERLRAELESAGTPVTDEIPRGGIRISDLTHDGQDLTPETHGTCPGRGVFLPAWNRTHPVHYCTGPAEYGHADRYAVTSTAGADSPGIEVPPPPDAAEDATPDPGRRLVIEGNKAWAAAAGVRKRWLGQLLARRAAPKEVARFVTQMLLAMPEPLRLSLAGAYAKPAFTEIAGHPTHVLSEEVDRCPAARLPLLMFAPIAAAYESEMYGADANRRSTWREDRYSPCSRQEAGRYLSFLASLGYHLAPIEQAVVGGVPYTGDTSGEPLVADAADAAAISPAGTSAETSGPDEPGAEAEGTDGDPARNEDPAALDEAEGPDGEVAEPDATA